MANITFSLDKTKDYVSTNCKRAITGMTDAIAEVMRQTQLIRQSYTEETFGENGALNELDGYFNDLTKACNGTLAFMESATQTIAKAGEAMAQNNAEIAKAFEELKTSAASASKKINAIGEKG